MPQLLGRSRVQVLTTKDLVLGKGLPVSGPRVLIYKVRALAKMVAVGFFQC